MKTTNPAAPGSNPRAAGEAAHTPAPWRIGDAGKTVFGPRSEQPAPVVICSVPGSSSRVSLAERQANARLIAAAPELLAQLIAMRRAAMDTPAIDDDPDWTARIQAADDAIRKATT